MGTFGGISVTDTTGELNIAKPGIPSWLLEDVEQVKKDIRFAEDDIIKLVNENIALQKKIIDLESEMVLASSKIMELEGRIEILEG